jgi:hypothetical protein
MILQTTIGQLYDLAYLATYYPRQHDMYSQIKRSVSNGYGKLSKRLGVFCILHQNGEREKNESNIYMKR